ncbi:uncharacterized protein O8D03_013449 [Erethizon dorsatum]
MKCKRKKKHLEPSLLEQPEKRPREELDFQEDDLQGRNNEVAPTQDQEESFTYSSNRFSYEDKFTGAGSSQGAGENSNNSEGCSRVSSAGQRMPGKRKGKRKGDLSTTELLVQSLLASLSLHVQQRGSGQRDSDYTGEGHAGNTPSRTEKSTSAQVSQGTLRQV